MKKRLLTVILLAAVLFLSPFHRIRIAKHPPSILTKQNERSKIALVYRESSRFPVHQRFVLQIISG